MKRALAVIIALLITLCGCTLLDPFAQPAQTAAPPESVRRVNVSEKQELSFTLYFLDKARKKLTTTVRYAEPNESQNIASLAMELLMDGPDDESQMSILPLDTPVPRVEVSGNFAGVYFNDDLEGIEESDRLVAHIAIVNTLCDIAGIEYVGVYTTAGELGGRTAEGYIPIGAMRKYTGNIGEFSQGLKNAISEIKHNPDYEFLMQSVLYFMDNRGEFLIPEIREILVHTGKFAAALVDELKKGPKNTVDKSAILAEDLNVSVRSDGVDLTSTPTPAAASDSPNINGEPSVMQESNGLTTAPGQSPAAPINTEPPTTGTQMPDEPSVLRIEMDKSPMLTTGEIVPDKKLAYASLAYSLYPVPENVNLIEFFEAGVPVNGLVENPIAENMVQLSDFQQFLGNGIKLYFPKAGALALVQINRSVPQNDAGKIETCLRELLKGPKENESEGGNVLPITDSGIEMKDFLDVSKNGDTVILNVNINFQTTCKKMDEQTEYLMVYSLVNTITELTGVRRVQFLVEGNPVIEIGSSLDYSHPLLRNPGLNTLG